MQRTVEKGPGGYQPPPVNVLHLLTYFIYIVKSEDLSFEQKEIIGQERVGLLLCHT